MLQIRILWNEFAFTVCRAVTDPRNGRRVAIKKLPNVFHSLVSCKRVYRELKMLCTFQHENVRIVSPVSGENVFLCWSYLWLGLMAACDTVLDCGLKQVWFCLLKHVVFC